MAQIGLEGHVSLITGGNGGIGLGMATGLANSGADVAIWGTNPEKLERAGEQLADVGVRVHCERCDVSDESQVEQSFENTLASLGKVDSVFANAGIAGELVPFVDLTLESWRKVIAINLEGTFLTLRAGARHMIERGEGGSLVAISSTSAIHGAANREPYSVSKTGLLGLVRALSVELARHRIRVNALLPGWTESEMTGQFKSGEKFVNNTVSRTPVRRWATPDEFAEVAVFLANPAITFHTGDTVVMDGGYTIF